MSSLFKRTRRHRSKGSTSKSKEGSVESVGKSSSDDGRLSVAPNALDDDDPRIRKFLYKLREAYTWKERYSSTSDEVYDLVKELLKYSASVQSQLAIEGKFMDADRLAKDIDEMKNFWGKELLNKFNLRTFDREIMEFGPFVITAAQYFEPEEMYPNNEKVTKVFSFSVADGHATTSNTIFKYYLVYSRHERDCYILDLLTSKGHYQVRPYGVLCPTYWAVRKDVLHDFSRKTGGMLGNAFIANLPTRV